MILAVTGHRSPIPLPLAVTSALTSLSPSLVLCGMAQGFDTLVADTCLSLSIPVHAYIPVSPDRHCSRWPSTIQAAYWTRLRAIRSSGGRIFNVSHPRGFIPSLFARNQAMIERSDHLLAWWDGRHTGGTHATLMHAELVWGTNDAHSRITYLKDSP